MLQDSFIVFRWSAASCLIRHLIWGSYIPKHCRTFLWKNEVENYFKIILQFFNLFSMVLVWVVCWWRLALIPRLFSAIVFAGCQLVWCRQLSFAELAGTLFAIWRRSVPLVCADGAYESFNWDVLQIGGLVLLRASCTETTEPQGYTQYNAALAETMVSQASISSSDCSFRYTCIL